MSCLIGDGTSVVYLRRCGTTRGGGCLARTSVGGTLGTCPCCSIHQRGEDSMRLTYFSGCPVLSMSPVSCRDACGNSIGCILTIGGSAIALVGGRLRSGGLAGRSQKVCRSVVGSPGTGGIGAKLQRLIGGLTRTSTVHTSRTSSMGGTVARDGCPAVVTYNSFGSNSVSCARHVLARGLSSTFARSNGKLKVSCGRGGFCFHVSGVLVDPGLGTCGYAMSQSVGTSSRCPV